MCSLIDEMHHDNNDNNNNNNNNNNNLIFILRKIHVNMIKCALHESKLSTFIFPVQWLTAIYFDLIKSRSNG